MSQLAIRVENLGKRYRIGARQERYKRFTETLMDTFSAPIRRLRNLGKPTPPEDIIWALKDVSFEVDRGEVLGIIGRNGAGKTTLLKVLSRITEPTEGRAEIHGRVGSLLEVGTGFHPELTGRENVYLNGAILGMHRAEIDAKFDEIVAFSEIEKFLDTPVKRYSSGMYVRLAFAVAAHLEPEILLVDEVLAVGDVGFQKKCLGKMQEVSYEGRTVLFVSHNMQVLRNLCQKGILLETGKIEEYGTIETTVNSYLRSFRLESGIVPTQPRSESSKAGLASVEVKSAEHGVDGKIFPGDGICIDSVVRVFHTIDALSIGFSLHAEDGRTIGITYSGPKEVFRLDVGEHLIRANIKSFPVNPGLYTLRARLEDHGQVIDWPKGDLAEFEVSFPTQLYGVRPETLASGRLYLETQWEKPERGHSCR